jgi:hypothetical protein
MMCMGTEMLKANAQLLSMFTAKNMRERRVRRVSGIFGGVKRMPVDVEEDLSCDGRAKRAVRRNWVIVMRRPIGVP